MQQRSLIRIHLRGGAEPLLWSPQPGKEEEDWDSINLRIGRESHSWFQLRDKDGAMVVDGSKIEAVELIHKSFRELDNPPTVKDLVRIAFERKCTAEELLQLIQEVAQEL